MNNPLRPLFAAFDAALARWSRGWTPTDDEAAELGFTKAEADRARWVLESWAAPPTLLALAMDAARYFHESLDDTVFMVAAANGGEATQLRQHGVASLDALRADTKGMAAMYATTFRGQELIREARRSLAES